MFNVLNNYVPVNIQKFNNIIINLGLLINLLVISVIIIVAVIIISHIKPKLITLRMTRDRVRFSLVHLKLG